MKKVWPPDELLDEVEDAQRRLEAEFDNNPDKLFAHYLEEQKKYAGRLIRSPGPAEIRRDKPAA